MTEVRHDAPFDDASPSSRHSWLGIEMRHLAALAAVASERSFGRAAEQLGYGQSAVSRQIAHLEQLVGARLIERSQGPAPVTLTDAGERLLAYASGILVTLDAARSDFTGLGDGEPRELRVGVLAGAASRILSPALATYRKQCAGVRVAVTESYTDTPLFESLRDRRIDVALVELPAEPGPFAVSEIMRVSWVLLVPAGTKLAARAGAPTPAEILRLPLIGLRSGRAEPSPASRLEVEAGEANVVAVCDGVQTAQSLVGSGVGAALVPRLAIQPNDARVEIVELGDLLPATRIGLASLRHRPFSLAVEHFQQIVREMCATLQRKEHATGTAPTAGPRAVRDLGPVGARPASPAEYPKPVRDIGQL